MADKEVANQLEHYLSELKELLKDCDNGILPQPEASKKLTKTINEIKGILPKDTRQYKIFDSEISKISLWWEENGSHYVTKQDCEKFKRLLNALQKVLPIYEPEFIEEMSGKTEFHFSKNEVAAAKMQIFETMKKAESILIIIDRYAGQDTEILNYIMSIKDIKKDLEIMILTEKAIPIFKEIVKDIKGLKVKKIKDVYHDRYLILDRHEVWHLGTSINGVGSGDFTITKLLDEKEKTRIIEDFNKYWAKAKNLDE